MNSYTHRSSNLSLLVTVLLVTPLYVSASTGEYSENLTLPLYGDSFVASRHTSARSLGSSLEFAIEELTYLSTENPFPPMTIKPIDPITKKKYARVLTGPSFRVRASGSDFDFYRYVTFYGIQTRKERAYSLPVHREDCLTKGDAFAGYDFSYNYTATVTVSGSIEGIGLSGSISQSRTFSSRRNLTALGNVVAEHIPFFEKQDWYGQTFIQTYDSKTGKTAFITRKQKESAWWIQIFFPFLAQTEYPMPFAIKDADWTFSVDRITLSGCGRR